MNHDVVSFSYGPRRTTVNLTRWFSVAALMLLMMGASQVQAKAEKKSMRETPSFSLLRSPAPETARSQALDWLKGVGKTDTATLKAFEQIWSGDRPLLDKVAATLALGDPAAAKLLAEARDPDTPAPTSVPSLIKDQKLPVFFRANLGLAYAKALVNRKVYDEALEVFKSIRGEDVVDPASYFFHRAVTEHALMMRNEADDSIDRLLLDVTDAPVRYRMVGVLMHYDMAAWQDKDLDWIARKMGVIKDRLELTRGGPKTRAMQREVLVKLDEMIKELENKMSGSCNCNGGNCPSGGSKGPPKGNRPSSPAGDFGLPSGIAKGEIDMKKFKEYAEVWGKLPERERAKAMTDLTRGMPAKYRDAIEAYFKQLEKPSK
jgi:tetratricopeptide (TPR) repeat protein